MNDPIAVAVGTCRCPGTPHPGGDTVYLAPKATLTMGVAAIAALQGSASTDDLQGRLAGVYLRFGITGWTFTDADGNAIRFDPKLIDELLPLWEGGMTLAQRADELYSPDVLKPFLAVMAQMSAPSPTGPTDDSTSASPPSGTTPRPPFVRSSRNGTGGKLSEVPAR
jgi:hypothetical protein